MHEVQATRRGRRRHVLRLSLKRALRHVDAVPPSMCKQPRALRARHRHHRAPCDPRRCATTRVRADLRRTTQQQRRAGGASGRASRCSRALGGPRRVMMHTICMQTCVCVCVCVYTSSTHKQIEYTCRRSSDSVTHIHNAMTSTHPCLPPPLLSILGGDATPAGRRCGS